MSHLNASAIDCVDHPQTRRRYPLPWCDEKPYNGDNRNLKLKSYARRAGAGISLQRISTTPLAPMWSLSGQRLPVQPSVHGSSRSNTSSPRLSIGLNNRRCVSTLQAVVVASSPRLSSSGRSTGCVLHRFFLQKKQPQRCVTVASAPTKQGMQGKLHYPPAAWLHHNKSAAVI